MSNHEFDVAVTFAGEDRPLVDEVVQLVKVAGFSVFYDEDAKVEMWGEDLTEYFADVYERRAKFAVMFVSIHYAAKAWTNWERRSVLSRALNSNSPYLLPVRIDSSDLPGMRSTIGYLDATKESAQDIADAIISKLGAPTTEAKNRFNDRVPRTAAEAAILLGERPGGWEYLHFSYLLSAGLDQRSEAYNDFRFEFALDGRYVPSGSLVDHLQAAVARMRNTMDVLNSLLLGPAQSAAFGEPGEPGDPDLIEHLAGRILAIYDSLINQARDLRSASSSWDEGREAMTALADYMVQPVNSMRNFISDLHDQMDELSDRIKADDPVKITMKITWDVSAPVSDRYHRAMEELERRLD